MRPLAAYRLIISEAGWLPWTHRAEVVADDDAQQEGQAPGPRVVHCLGSCGLTNSHPRPVTDPAQGHGTRHN